MVLVELELEWEDEIILDAKRRKLTLLIGLIDFSLILPTATLLNKLRGTSIV